MQTGFRLARVYDSRTRRGLKYQATNKCNRTYGVALLITALIVTKARLEFVDHTKFCISIIYYNLLESCEKYEKS